MNKLTCCVTLLDGFKCKSKRLTNDSQTFLKTVQNNVSSAEMREELYEHIYVCSKHLPWRIEEMIRNGIVDSLADYDNLRRCKTCGVVKLELDYENGYEICKKCIVKDTLDKVKLMFRKMNNIKKCNVDGCENKCISDNIYINVDVAAILNLPKVYLSYCLTHQLDAYRRELLNNCKKLCNNYIIKGCRNMVDLKKKLCQNCTGDDKAVSTSTEQSGIAILQCKHCNDVLSGKAFYDNVICVDCKLNKIISKNVPSDLSYENYLVTKESGFGIWKRSHNTDLDIDKYKRLVMELLGKEIDDTDIILVRNAVNNANDINDINDMINESENEMNDEDEMLELMDKKHLELKEKEKQMKPTYTKREKLKSKSID
jgi:transcription initiation factor TFIIIB Brf1 subunit/transcription initiation factor TFIIB